MQIHLTVVVSTFGWTVLSHERVTNEICKALVSFLTIFSFSLSSHHPFFAFCFVSCYDFGCGFSCSFPSPPSVHSFHLCLPPFAISFHTSSLAWQGTDLMHNHVLADDDQSSLDSLGRRSSLSRLEPSDLSEDSDYDSIWTAHSYRMGSTSRKSCCSYISHQN